jgi:Beta-lactamase enzyme family
MAGTTLEVPPPPVAHRRRRRAAAALGAIALLAFVAGAIAGARGAGGRGSESRPTPGGAGVISQRSLAAARAYAASRKGRVAFAVVDRGGRVRGWNEHGAFVSASVVKAMLLVALLRRHDVTGRPITAAERFRISQMIGESDNDAATAVWREVGDKGLRSLAQLAGMQDFTLGPLRVASCRCRAERWARAQVSARDQARLLYDLDAVTPPRYRFYARTTLQDIERESHWGVVGVAEQAGYRPYFKVGVRLTGLGTLVHQVALLERPHERFGIAVLTDGNPSEAYGKETVRGIGQRLLAGRA